MNQSKIEETALVLYNQNKDKAIGFLTKYSVDRSENVFNRWKKLFGELMVKYIDGNVKTKPGTYSQPGYSEKWYREIIKDSGDFYKVPE